MYYFCLCKSFKELFLHASVSESGCKGTHFFRTNKTFQKKFLVFTQYFFASWRISRHMERYNLIILYKRTLIMHRYHFRLKHNSPLKVKQVVLLSKMTSERVEKIVWTKVKQLVLLLRIRHARSKGEWNRPQGSLVFS